MDKYTSDKYSLLGYLLIQTGFESLEEYDKFKEKILKEADDFVAQNKKNK